MFCFSHSKEKILLIIGLKSLREPQEISGDGFKSIDCFVYLFLLLFVMNLELNMSYLDENEIQSHECKEMDKLVYFGLPLTTINL